MAKSGWKGIDKVVSEIRKFGAEAEAKINAETQAIAFQIEKDAKIAAPKNFGKLQQSISHEKINESNYKVTVNEYYGAYMEFGTGKKVSVPAEFADMAAQFKGPTGRSFEDGVKSIEEWLRAKGGDPTEAKWVLLKILGAGLSPQPFLYPAWQKGKNDYRQNLNKLLKRLQKKI